METLTGPVENGILSDDCPFCKFQKVMKMKRMTLLNMSSLIGLGSESVKTRLVSTNIKKKQDTIMRNLHQAIVYWLMEIWQKKRENYITGGEFDYEEDGYYFSLKLIKVFDEEIDGNNKIVNTLIELHCHKH
jgi:hypothetical protein